MTRAETAYEPTLRDTPFPLMQVGTVFRNVSEKVDPRIHEPLSVGQLGVTPQLEGVAQQQGDGEKKLVRPGQIAMNSRSDRRGASGLSEYEGVVSVVYTVLQPDLDYVHPRFAHHLFRSLDFQNEYYRWGTGIVDDLWSTKFERLAQIRIPLPDLDTQRRIADYLDKEISEMDALIEEFEGLVRNLRARKPMLIDNILAGFPVAPLALSWKVVDCLHITAPFIDSGENYLVSIEQLGSEDLILASANRTDGDTFTKMREGERKPSPGDVIMSRNASVGKSSIVKESDPPIALGQDVVIFKNNETNDSRLLYYFLQSNALKRAVDMNTVGSTLKRINVSSIKSLPYPVLALEEQQLIAEKLRRETAKMDALIEESTRLIENLKARKTALITEVVTGRKEV